MFLVCWRPKAISYLFLLVMLTGCDLANLSSSMFNQTVESIKIAGAGIKGPLAFADVRMFRLDTSKADYFDRLHPVTSTQTNAYASIENLASEDDYIGPYILVINGENAVDLTTGTTPIITTLITVVTRKMLLKKRPVYATPYTTLAYYMAQLKSGVGAQTGKFLNEYKNSADLISASLGFGMSRNINILEDPPVINGYTTSLDDQAHVAEHRAALEALAAIVYELSTRDSSGKLNANDILFDLAMDLSSDEVIDDRAVSTIGTIDTTIFNRDPMNLVVPNTSITIRSITKILGMDMQFLNTRTAFLGNSIQFSLRRAALKPASVTLKWNQTPNTQGYLVYYRPGTEAAYNMLSDIRVTKPDFDATQPSVTYRAWVDLGANIGDNVCFRIKSYNRDGTSGWSEPVCKNV